MLYDSSVLIDYLDGRDSAVQYIESHLDERAVAPQLVLFEVYQGEVFKSGPANFDAVDGALGWLTPVETSAGSARAGAQVQAELDRRGAVLSARDAFIAGAAVALDEPLAVADDDFDVAGLEGVLDIEFPDRDATEPDSPPEESDSGYPVRTAWRVSVGSMRPLRAGQTVSGGRRADRRCRCSGRLAPWPVPGAESYLSRRARRRTRWAALGRRPSRRV